MDIFLDMPNFGRTLISSYPNMCLVVLGLGGKKDLHILGSNLLHNPTSNLFPPCKGITQSL